jgi:hypothetical protein
MLPLEMVAFLFIKPYKEPVHTLHYESLSLYKISRLMSRLQNAINIRLTKQGFLYHSSTAELITSLILIKELSEL